MLDKVSLNYSLIWNNLRNLIDMTAIKIPGNLKLVDAVQGRFPVEDYKPIFFEYAKDNRKQHLLARSNTFNGTVKWFNNRRIDLPIYEYTDDMNDDEFKNEWQTMLKQWHYTNMPENIPSIAVASRIIGNYSDEREGQFLFVIFIWHNKVARIFKLDWFEGPLEDCISPEWYMNSTPVLSIDNIIPEIEKMINHLPCWKNQTYSLFLKPNIFGKYLTNVYKKTNYNNLWKEEFYYEEKKYFIQDLIAIAKKIIEFSFSK